MRDATETQSSTHPRQCTLTSEHHTRWPPKGTAAPQQQHRNTSQQTAAMQMFQRCSHQTPQRGGRDLARGWHSQASSAHASVSRSQHARCSRAHPCRRRAWEQQRCRAFEGGENPLHTLRATKDPVQRARLMGQLDNQ